MNRSLPQFHRNLFSSRRALRPLAALALVAWSTCPGFALEIVAIEEHWELSVGQPDAASSSPQVSMVMSPTGNLDATHFIFTLNHHTDPEWIPGGLQVQHWDGEDLVQTKAGVQEEPLSSEGETISWVQRTELKDGHLYFEVASGSSESWGEFGGAGNLRLKLNTSMTNLNGYRPAISIEGSGVCFAGNRVKNLTLKKLRWIDSDGKSYELNAPIDVDADLDP
jgi:hypothetical protein